jgi:hypothetical protein|tara:strand:- start:205 stop:447 length:243 start_codon:yes stop_codon:yes gene_type:complete
VGKLKKLLADAAECLQVPIEEVMEMSLVEINTLLEEKNKKLEQAELEIEAQIKVEEDRLMQLGWDVDVDEDGPFICIAES